MKTDSIDPSTLVGLDAPDDAGVYRVAPDLAIVQSVDFFTPIVDDPFDWGRIAATNALSDIYAMGARPVTALNLVGWPRSLDLSLLGRVVEGAQEVCGAAGVSLIGGHSIEDDEPKFGLAVTGLVHPDRIITTRGADPGGDLILTKALGTGIVSSAIKADIAPPRTVAAAIEVMTTLNRSGAEIMVEHAVRHATDVTGFGLAGHLLEMLDRRLDATIRWSALPVIEGVEELAGEGVLPGGTRRNAEAAQDLVESSQLSPARRWLLYDAQTSGGLLMAVPHERSAEVLAALRGAGLRDAALIGSLRAGSGRIEVVS